MLLLACVACRKTSVPRPYGYFRIAIPPAVYHDTVVGPYQFAMSANAVLHEHMMPGERYWIDLEYPTLKAKIHCSYKPIDGNLRGLTADALEFVYKHASMSTSIPEREFANPEDHVYGVLFTLRGNIASPYQFFLTDSVHHFFRAAAYCECRPNQDSLQPVWDYLQADIETMIQSFRWPK